MTASPRLDLVAACVHDAPSHVVAEAPALLARHAKAAVVVTLPPNAARRVLAQCAAARRVVVAAPVDGADLPDALDASVVHGWSTLPGRTMLEGLPARAKIGHVRVTARGAPDGRDVDLREAVAHALSWSLCLDPTLAVTRARSRADGEVEVTLCGQKVASVELDVAIRGAELTTELDTDVGRIVIAWREGLEQRDLAGSSRRVRVASADQRLLATLLQPPAEAYTLAHARRVATLCAAVDDHARLAPDARAFALSRALQAAGDEGAALGLLSALPTGPEAKQLVVAEPSAPAEVFALRAGVRPAAFLTLSRDDARRPMPELDGLHVVRSERDDVVELFVAKDAERAQRIATLQHEPDPSRHLSAIGELLGYPACCVAAFARQITRHDDAYNRHAAAQRTTAGVWPWELNDFVVKLVPFFPCRYDCARALEQARRTLATIDAAQPGIAESLRVAMARPFLVVGPDRVLAFEGAVRDDAVHYDAVLVLDHVSAELRALASALNAGTQLWLAPDALVLRGESERTRRIERCDPALCMLLPFGQT